MGNERFPELRGDVPGWSDDVADLNDHLAGERRQAIMRADFVPLMAAEFQAGNAIIVGVLTGTMAPASTLPTQIHDAATDQAANVQDTPLLRAWLTAGLHFTDEAKRMSFFYRQNKVMPLTKLPPYAEYVDKEAGSMHIALATAVASVRFSARTTPKALRAAFDAEFQRQLARTIDIDEPTSAHRH
jgi:hypothetical protein